MKYIDADLLRELLDTKYKEFTEKAKKDCPLQYQYMADGLVIAKQFIDSLPDEPDVNRPEPYSPVYNEAYLKEKIDKATESWKGVDVDAMLAECRGYEEPATEEVDLPRWRKYDNGACGSDMPIAIVRYGKGSYAMANCLASGDEYIMLSDLEKLPKEDGK